MSYTQADTALIQRYKDGFELLCQQEVSKLRPTVDVEMGAFGEYEYFDQISSTSTAQLTTRHADTTITETSHARRRVQLLDFAVADLIDWQDVYKMSSDPQNAYIKNAVMAMNRTIDDQLIAAASGTAYTGKTGSTSTSFTAGNIITCSGGLTVEKLQDGKYILDVNDVPASDRFVIIHPYQLDNLLSEVKITSADYNNVKALVRGEVDTFLGFKFVTSTRVVKSGTTRMCWMYHRDALKLAMANDVKVQISDRPDKNHAAQVYISASFGATRMDEDKIVRLDCTES